MEQHTQEASNLLQWLGGLITAGAVTMFGFALKRRESQRTLLTRIDQRTCDLVDHLDSVSSAGKETRRDLEDHKTAERPHASVAVRIDSLEQRLSNGSG